MKKRVFNFVGLVVFAIIILVSIAYSVSWSITGYSTFGIQSDFSYCDINISCGYSSWSDNTVYCLNASNTTNDNTCFSDISANNVTLDLQGFSITDVSGPSGSTSYGVFFSGSNATLRNGDIQNFTYGVYFDYSDNSTLFNVSVYNTTYGAYLNNSHNGTLYNSTIYSNQNTGVYLFASNESNISFISTSSHFAYGFFVADSYHNSFMNLSSLNDIIGFYINNSDYNALTNSTFTNNRIDVLLGDSFFCSNEFSFLTGTNSLPITYYNTTVDLQDWDNNFSSFILCNGSDSVLDNMTLNPSSVQTNSFFFYGTNNLSLNDITSNNSYVGIKFVNLTNSVVNNTVTLDNFDDGVRIEYSSDNYFYNVSSESSLDYGVSLRYSNNNVLDNVTSHNNSDSGIYLFNSDSNSLTNSHLHNNTDHGILFVTSDSNDVFNSTLEYNVQHGIRLLLSDSNNLSNITLQNNSGYGIHFERSDSNYMYHSFVYNNSLSGILINGSDSNYLFNLTLLYNTLDGINFIGSSLGNSNLNSILESNISFNSRNGINISLDSSENTIVVSDVRNNSGNGLFILDSESNYFYELFFGGNTLSGINTTNTTNSLYRNPIISENTNSNPFTEVTNNTFYANFSDNAVGIEVTSDFTIPATPVFNFSSHVQFGSNWADINDSALPNEFNTTTRITIDLTGESITNPMPILGGVLCSTCTAESFSNDLFTFEVTYLANYSVNQSSCGDSYCSIGESCTSCESDCGACSSGDSGGGSSSGGGGGSDDGSNSSDDSSDSGSSSGGSSNSGSNSDSSNDESEGTLDSLLDSYSDLPWLWIVIGAAVLLFVIIIVITIFVFIKNNRDGSSVIHASRPTVPIRSPILASTQSNNVTQAVPLSQGTSPSKPQIPVQTKKAALSPKPSLIFGVSSIRDYVNTQSTNSKVRIRYFLESGYMFLEKKDFESCKEIYKFIYDEYRKLEFHDEKLYQAIMTFRLGIR